ncbi:MAG: PqqD family protein [candidate division WOR-3 bacterium]|nr:PqqD family protein [candidate division WOR-3 bacterium]MCX7756942.1 PqqD family protein [candidate division WOR-3 bacterium]MDW7987714.1 PqqD family protein [candidate division WOR-3 bacterium]
MPKRDSFSYLKELAISESGFIFDPQTGNSYVTNELGREIIIRLRNGSTEKEIFKYILENYDVSEEILRRDYEVFLLRLRQYGLI